MADELPWRLRFAVDFDTVPANQPTSWVDLTGRVRAPATVVYGRPAGGHVALTLNDRDRMLDPTNPASPYDLGPMRHARLTVDLDGSTKPLWRGFVEEWPPRWPQPGQGLVAVRLVDATAWLALQEADVDLPGEFTGQRIRRLLALAGWPPSLTDVDDGQVRVDPYVRDGANLLRVIQDTGQAEAGELYVDPSGVVTFRDRHHRFDQTPVMQVGGDGLRVASTEPDFSAGTVVNIARFEFTDGRVSEMVDDDSVDRHGPRTATTRDLPLSDREAEAHGQWQVVTGRDPQLYLDRTVMRGHADRGALLGAALDRRLGDLVSVSHDPPGGGGLAVDLVVDRIRHRIRKGEWLVEWDLAPYHGAGPWLTWDDEGSVGYSDIYTDIYEATPVGDDEAWDAGRWAP